jgi:hypothetical protein
MLFDSRPIPATNISSPKNTSDPIDGKDFFKKARAELSYDEVLLTHHLTTNQHTYIYLTNPNYNHSVHATSIQRQIIQCKTTI